MVTTTTKNLNYSITNGQRQNSVNATITSTDGFNGGYLGKFPGILKLLELIIAAISLGLIASLRSESRLLVTEVNQPLGNMNYTSYPREMFLIGEVYFLCAHSAVLTMLSVMLMAYLFHTVSSMVVPKASALENFMNIVLFMLLLVAGVVELVEAVKWRYGTYGYPVERTVYLQHNDEFATRIAAGALAIINSILFLVSYAMSRKELAGPEKSIG